MALEIYEMGIRKVSDTSSQFNVSLQALRQGLWDMLIVHQEIEGSTQQAEVAVRASQSGRHSTVGNR